MYPSKSNNQSSQSKVTKELHVNIDILSVCICDIHYQPTENKYRHTKNDIRIKMITVNPWHYGAKS